MRGFDLVALGEVALDLILAGVDKVPRRWSELGRAKAAGIFAAGSAGYVAQCFSKLGGRASIVGRIGDDTPGRITSEGFRQCGVSTHNLVVDKRAETEVSTVIVYKDGNKSSVLSRVPPLRLDRLDIDCLEGAKALHIGAYLVLPDLWGSSTLRWMRYARSEGALISVDPQMSTTGEWSKPFDRIIEHVDILMLDEEEAKRISQKKRIIDAIEKLAARGHLTVAVKAGKKGCIIGKDDRICSVKPFRAEPISTIGAGDAFDAAFIYGSLEGWTIEEIGRFSNVVAALSMTKLGCMTAIPRAGVAERIAKSYYS